MKIIEFMGMNLILDTKAKVQLEDKIGGSPLKYIFGAMGGAMTEEELDVSKIELPPLKIMILTIHASAQKLNANISVDKVMDKVDEFLEEHSVMELFSEVFMQLLMAGRYLPTMEQE